MTSERGRNRPVWAIAIVILAAALTLSGCGRKGPVETPPDAGVVDLHALPGQGAPTPPPPRERERDDFFLDFLL